METSEQEVKKDSRLVVSVLVAILIHPLVGGLVIIVGAFLGFSINMGGLNNRIFFAVFPALLLSVYFVNLVYERKKKD